MIIPRGLAIYGKKPEGLGCRAPGWDPWRKFSDIPARELLPGAVTKCPGKMHVERARRHSEAEGNPALTRANAASRTRKWAVGGPCLHDLTTESALRKSLNLF